MTAKSFSERLYDCFVNQIPSSELTNNDFFQQTHFANSPNNKIKHRCYQWLYDLKSNKKKPCFLKVDDLQAACEITRLPAGALVEGEVYWNRTINYLDDDNIFLKLIEQLYTSADSDKILCGLHFPICYHPATGTLLVAEAVEIKKKKGYDFLNYFSNNSLIIKTTHIMKYTVLSNSTIKSWRKLDSNYVAQIRKDEISYEDAKRTFDTVCKYEVDSNEQLSMVARLKALAELIESFSDSQDSEEPLSSILNYQPLFYGYHSNILTDKTKHIKRKHHISLDAQIVKFAKSLEY